MRVWLAITEHRNEPRWFAEDGMPNLETFVDGVFVSPEVAKDYESTFCSDIPVRWFAIGDDWIGGHRDDDPIRGPIHFHRVQSWNVRATNPMRSNPLA